MSKKVSKRRKAILEKLTPSKVYPFNDALALLAGLPLAKFKKSSESVDISLNLGVDPRNSAQVVRGSVVLPNGTGKTVRVAVFTQGNNVEIAKQAGADLVGMEDLAELIKAGEMNFDVVIATPDTMGIVGKLGPILGPRGLMPNPKVGTVTPDVAKAVKNAKGGQVMYKTDKAGIVHCTFGKVNFTTEALKQNLEVLLNEIKRAKPSSSKGIYMKKLTVSTTMGPGLQIDLASVNV
jgi:large subunit ribosomal protein L1